MNASLRFFTVIQLYGLRLEFSRGIENELKDYVNFVGDRDSANGWHCHSFRR